MVALASCHPSAHVQRRPVADLYGTRLPSRRESTWRPRGRCRRHTQGTGCGHSPLERLQAAAVRWQGREGVRAPALPTVTEPDRMDPERTMGNTSVGATHRTTPSPG
jgi:hypothetical protein